MTRFLSFEGAMLLSASHDIPPVNAPSPTTTTTWRLLWLVRANPREIPSAQERAVEA